MVKRPSPVETPVINGEYVDGIAEVWVKVLLPTSVPTSKPLCTTKIRSVPFVTTAMYVTEGKGQILAHSTSSEKDTDPPTQLTLPDFSTYIRFPLRSVAAETVSSGTSSVSVLVDMILSRKTVSPFLTSRKNGPLNVSV